MYQFGEATLRALVVEAVIIIFVGLTLFILITLIESEWVFVRIRYLSK